jgi:hypothetical protein
MFLKFHISFEILSDDVTFMVNELCLPSFFLISKKTLLKNLFTIFIESF